MNLMKAQRVLGAILGATQEVKYNKPFTAKDETVECGRTRAYQTINNIEQTFGGKPSRLFSKPASFVWLLRCV